MLPDETHRGYLPTANPVPISDGGTGATSAAAALTALGALPANGSAPVTGVLDLNAGSDTAGSAPVITPTLANGTPAQLADTTRDYMLYLQIGTPGTGFVLKLGPTSTPANTIMASATPTADELISVRVPAGWYVEWSGSSTTITTQTAIGC